MTPEPRDRLIGALLRPPEPPPEPSPALLEAMALAYTTLDPELERFLTDAVPRLLRQLRHLDQRVRVQTQDRLRGVVDWAGTTRLQAARGPGAMVVRQAQRVYDLPENRLLVGMIQTLAPVLRRPGDLRGLRVWDSRQTQGLDALRRLSRLEEGLRRLEQSPRLAGLNAPDAVEPALLRARDTGQPEYAALAALVERRLALAKAPSLDALAAALPRAVVLPVRAGDDDAAWVYLAHAALQKERADAPAIRPRPLPESPRRPGPRRASRGYSMAV